MLCIWKLTYFKKNSCTRNELFSITTSSGLLSMKFDIGLSVQWEKEETETFAKSMTRICIELNTIDIKTLIFGHV